MDAPILVTGALGNVGAEVVKSLLATGKEVRAADLSVEAIRKVFGDRLQAVYFDFVRPETFPAALSGTKRMFLIRPPHIGNVKRDMLPFIEAAKADGIEQVVFLSILHADKLKVVPHYSVEKILKRIDIDYVFLRSAYFMQNLSGIHAPEIRKQNEIFIPAGHGRLGMIDVRDVGAVAARALLEGHRNQVYQLTGAEALTFDRAAQQFSEVLGRTIRYADPGIWKFFRLMRRRGVPAGLAIFMIVEYSFTKMGRSGTVTPEVENILGRKPVSFKQFVEDYGHVWL